MGDLKNELAIINSEQGLSQIVTASRNAKNLPYVFTEPGVAMLSSVLKSDLAIDVNITIIRTFIVLRQYISDYSELSAKINSIETHMDRKFKDIHEALNYLMTSEKPTTIGFKLSSQNP